MHSILKERDAVSVELAGYLKELGYEWTIRDGGGDENSYISKWL